MSSKEKNKPRPRRNPDQRMVVIQRILFVGFAVMIILAMVLSAVASF